MCRRTKVEFTIIYRWKSSAGIQVKPLYLISSSICLIESTLKVLLEHTSRFNVQTSDSQRQVIEFSKSFVRVWLVSVTKVESTWSNRYVWDAKRIDQVWSIYYLLDCDPGAVCKYWPIKAVSVCRCRFLREADQPHWRLTIICFGISKTENLLSNFMIARTLKKMFTEFLPVRINNAPGVSPKFGEFKTNNDNRLR